MKCFIMFADVCRSTHLYEKLGDQTATALVTRALDTAGEVVRQLNGVVVDSGGDEVLCTFERSIDALLAARKLHRTMEKFSADQGHPLQLRIGLNHGEVIDTADNIYGDAVNVGSRLASEAKAGQTVLSLSVVEQSPVELHPQIRELDEIWIRGKIGTHRIFELLEANPDTAITVEATREIEIKRAFMLTLKRGTFLARLNPTSNRFTLGRSEDCDLMIAHPTVSRTHAEIQHRNGQFVFIDLSTNGSHVVIGGRPNQLQRNSIELRGKGTIALGRTNSMPNQMIHFEVVN